MDEHGFMWIISELGLVRFDGQHFCIINRKFYPELASDYIAPLGFTVDNRIVFNDNRCRVYAFNKHNQLVQVKRRIAPWLFIHKNNYQSYTPAERKEIDSMNLWICDYRSDENYLLPLKIKNTSRGFVCINSRELLYVSGKRVVWQMPLQYYRSAVRGYAGHLGENFYYLDPASNLKQVDKYSNITQPVLKGIDAKLKVQGDNGFNHALFQQGEELYLLEGKGIYKLKASGEHELTAELMLETEVQSISVYRNYPEYNLQVIGSQTRGLYLFRKKQFKVLTFSNGLGNFYPQAPYKNSGVLTVFGTIFPDSCRLDYPFKGEENRSILLDRHGHYWINQSDYKLRTGSAHITELDEHLNAIRTLRNRNGIDCYRETPDGNIWVSTFRGQLLGKVSGDSIAWLKTSWPYGTFITFLPENDTAFWVGGQHTFMKLNVRTGKEKHYKYLEQFTIETLYLDKNKVLWIGTRGSGFFALKNNKLYQLPPDEKGSLNNVHTFLEDKSGYMWMTTNNGLFRCKKKDADHFLAGKATDVYYQCFKKESGFNTNEFNGSCTPSGITLGNGKFSLPSIDGLVQFYPDSINEVLPDKKIFIDKLLVDGKERNISGHISLLPSFERIEIQVASPFFGLPDNQQLEYNIKGLDQNWYPVNNENKIVLNRFPYGNYTLQFRKHAGFGIDNLITNALVFKVTPFFYQTWYFKLGLFLLAGLLIFLFVKIRYAYLMKRNKELEQVIIQRTAHLDNANRLKEKMLVMVGHDLQSPLLFLGHLSKINSDAAALKQHDRIAEVSQHINSTAKKISTFVEEFSLWARVQDETFSLRKTGFPISTLISDLEHFSKDILQFNGNTLECKIDNDYLLHTNQELLKAVLRNLIDNANKHTKNGLISVTCTESNNTSVITVTDNGEGISEDRLKRINELLLEARHFNITEPANGRLGYQFIADFVARLQANISITSEKDKGTTVCISGITIGAFPHKPEEQLT